MFSKDNLAMWGLIACIGVDKIMDILPVVTAMTGLGG